MSKQKFSIPKISCGHCVAAIKDELTDMEGVTSVEGNPGEKTITVEFSGPATVESLKAKLEEINYPAA